MAIASNVSKGSKAPKVSFKKVATTNPESTDSGLVALLLIGVLIWVVTRLCVRVGVGAPDFSYTLDDPFIHLRMAQQIASGHYGINAGEFSSPSSSILWPFLLTPTIRTPFAVLAPLYINVACVMGLVMVGFGAFGMRTFGALKVLALLLFTNAVGLIFTGMEHCLQVLLSVGCAWGAVAMIRTKRVSPWLLVALVLGPLVRYENLGITVPVAVLLFAYGHRRKAGLVLGLVALGVGGFSLFLHSLGLGWLPNSVEAKSGVWYLTSTYNWSHSQIQVLFQAALVVAIFFAYRKTPSIGLVALAAGGVHFALGRYGWYERYECYMNGFLLALLLQSTEKILTWPVRAWALMASGLVVCAAGYKAGRIYFERARLVPADAQDISTQQLEMHRFVTEYWKAPVGVNDLGWVSYDNPNFVLDLWGLGSSDALQHRLQHNGTAWMNPVCQEHGVKLCMVYEYWFDKLPSNWVRVARMRRGSDRGGVVSFFATDPKAAAEIRNDLTAFAPSLNGRSVLEFDGLGSGSDSGSAKL